MLTATEVLSAFENIRRAQRAGTYAPHKPILILLALARVQQGLPRQVQYADIDLQLKQLLSEFGPSSAPGSRHYPFWHLATDGLWELSGSRDVLNRPAAATPNLSELRDQHIAGGFRIEIDEALRSIPGLLEAVGSRVLNQYFPQTLHEDIAASVGLDLITNDKACEDKALADDYQNGIRRRRNSGFRERVLRAYEYRCCICGFDLRIGQASAGLEAAHIHWHHAGGPDVESNGLSLCALHHKLFDLGVFTLYEPDRITFSQLAISGGRGLNGELRFHGMRIHLPQQKDQLPGTTYLDWNHKNVFKAPARAISN